MESGERFLLASGDRILPENIGARVAEQFPGYRPPTALAPPPAGGAHRSDPVWMRVQMRNDKVARAVGARACPSPVN